MKKRGAETVCTAGSLRATLYLPRFLWRGDRLHCWQSPRHTLPTLLFVARRPSALQAVSAPSFCTKCGAKPVSSQPERVFWRPSASFCILFGAKPVSSQPERVFWRPSVRRRRRLRRRRHRRLRCRIRRRGLRRWGALRRIALFAYVPACAFPHFM